MKSIWLMIVPVIVLASCQIESIDHQPISLHGPHNEEVTLDVEIADTPEARTTGLMHRDSIGKHDGMLFIFDTEEERSFWMKNTRIALDILFFDANGTFVSRRSMEPCTKDPCRSYTSSGPATYALEVLQGHADLTAVTTGWTLSQ